MPKLETVEEEVKELTHVRWEIPKDAMLKLIEHQKILRILQPGATREDAAVDLIRSRKLPKIMIVHD